MTLFYYPSIWRKFIRLDEIVDEDDKEETQIPGKKRFCSIKVSFGIEGIFI
jgi:hypothetical protein